MDVYTLFSGKEATGVSETIPVLDTLRTRDYNIQSIAVMVSATTTEALSRTTGAGLDDATLSGFAASYEALDYKITVDAERAIGAATAGTGTVLNDCTSGGTYTGATDKDYVVEIDAVADIGAVTATCTGLDDCTSGGAFTGDVNTDYQVKIDAEADIAAAVITGDGLNDCTSGGTYTGPTDLTYVVEIDAEAAAGTDTFKWSKDGGKTWEDTSVAMTGAAQNLDNGVTVMFTTTTGHTLGDLWTIAATVDTFTWSNGAGSTTGVSITGAAQTLENGVTVTFGSATGHTLADLWDFTATVDTFKWSDDGGSNWDATGVSITEAAQDLNNGVTVTFGSATDHTLGDTWDIAATVDTFKWSNDNGVTWEATGVSMTGAAQYLENGLSVTFATVVGHTLNDSWTAAVTTGFVGTVNLEGTIATDAEVAAGTATFIPITDMSWTAVGIKSLTTQCTHVRGNVSVYKSGSITMKIGK